MSNVIHLLPDAVANQIAAGEVIQRPASVIKELVENAIDAGATSVKVSVRDAGRTLIQVIDDGCGMNETDARLAFERHATSKISQVTDLYQLHTMGFRGEALASIAAVAQVELLTRRADDELGVKIEIAGSKVTCQEPVATQVGSQFIVRNLFFNIPARRAFLKSDAAEMRHVTQEFLRVALAHPSIALSLSANGTPLFTLPSGNMKQRVSGVVGKALSQELLPIEVETNIISIKGFVGSPDTSRKTNTDQYFFANDRYMRSPYFHKAVIDAYKDIIPPDQTPAYFIYMTVDPKSLDVNVHPQKTEIKFEDETAIWQILNASVRDCLGKFDIMPSIDFDTADQIEIPTYIPDQTVHPHDIPSLTPGSDIVYNPFEQDASSVSSRLSSHSGDTYSSRFNSGDYRPSSRPVTEGWETLYSRMSPSPTSYSVSPDEQSEVIVSHMGRTSDDATLFQPDEQIATPASRFFQHHCRYIVTPVKSGLMFIDQHRAHERIQYEAISQLLSSDRLNPSQQLLFPELLPMNAEDACIIEEMSDELSKAGFDLHYDASQGQLAVTSIPVQLEISHLKPIIESIIFDASNGEVNIHDNLQDYVIRALASQSAIPYGKVLTSEEMSNIYDKLLTCSSPSLSPSGKCTMTIISNDDIESRF